LVDNYLGGAYAVLAYDPAATPSFTRSLTCPEVAAQRPCAGAEVDVVLWDDLLRAEGPGWMSRSMPHGARLRIEHAPRTSSLRVSEGLGAQIVPQEGAEPAADEPARRRTRRREHRGEARPHREPRTGERMRV